MATISGMVGVGNFSMFSNYATQNNRSSLNSLWQNYGNFSANAASSLASLSEIKTNAAAVVDSYDKAKDAFYSEFDGNMSALSKSAANMKNLKIDVGDNPITKTAEVDKDGNVVKDKDGNTVMKTTYSKGMESALNTVKDLVNNYNSSIKFLNDNSEVSSRVSRMASNFGDTTYRSSNYESIGISVGKDGSLTIDEDTLAKALAEDPDKVSSILGKDGLAGKAEQHIETANSQRSKLFPAAKSMLGDELAGAALYTGKSMINMTMLSNIGNLVNMML